jgi:hypothetical protein
MASRLVEETIPVPVMESANLVKLHVLGPGPP